MEPARQRDLKQRNLAAVLAVVAAADPPISRAGTAARTGLTRATVSSLVEELVTLGLLEEVDPPPATGAGRPAAGLRLSGARVAGLGIEVGVDHLAACVVDLAGVVRGRRVVSGDHRGAPAGDVLGRAAGLGRDLRAAAESGGLDVVGATVAVPGLVRAGETVVALAPNLGWRDVDVLAVTGRTLDGLRVAVGNEADLAALAELGPPGRVPARSSFLLVSGEVGIGGGVVLGGRLHPGENGFGGELGHVTVDPRGPDCACGSCGCLEVYAGQQALLRAAGVTTLPSTSLGGRRELDALLSSATEGQPPMLAALDRAATALGVAVSSAVNVLDVDTVVLGGIHAVLAPWLRAGVQREVDRRVLRARLHPVAVEVSSLGADAVMLGAARAVLRGVLDRPGDAAALATA